ncbi:MAG: MFS transporter [Clostridium sp.]|nr:MFS transporter [Clostridium sp.]
MSNANVKLSLKEKISYGVSDSGYNILFTVVTSFLMFYYTDVVGMNVAVVGTLFLIVRVMDGISGPIIGALIDKTNTKWGKCRPWFLWFAAPYALISILTFAVPGISNSGKIVYMYITYILLNILALAVGSPITAMLPSLTTNLEERFKANSFRTMLGQISVIVAGSFTLPLVEVLGKGNSQKGFLFTMIVFGIISFALLMTTFRNTRERVVIPKAEEPKFKDSLKAILHNFPCLLLTLMNFVIFTGVVVKAQATVYFFKYNIGNVNIASIANAINALSMIVAMAFVPMIAKKMKNRNMVILGFAISIVGQGILYLAANNHSLVLTLVGISVAAAGLGGGQSVVFVMFADVVDYGQWKTGIRSQGLLTTFGTIGTNCGAGIAAVLMSFILASSGFVANAKQTVHSLNAISFCYVWLPIITLVICIVLMLFYKIDYIRDKILADLAERQK